MFQVWIKCQARALRAGLSSRCRSLVVSPAEFPPAPRRPSRGNLQSLQQPNLNPQPWHGLDRSPRSVLLTSPPLCHPDASSTASLPFHLNNQSATRLPSHPDVLKHSHHHHLHLPVFKRGFHSALENAQVRAQIGESCRTAHISVTWKSKCLVFSLLRWWQQLQPRCSSAGFTTEAEQTDGRLPAETLFWWELACLGSPSAAPVFTATAALSHPQVVPKETGSTCWKSCRSGVREKVASRSTFCRK